MPSPTLHQHLRLQQRVEDRPAVKSEPLPVEWMRLSCDRFKDNAARLALFVPAYNLGDFLWRLVLPKEMARWSLTSLRERLVKIGVTLRRHARRLVLQMVGGRSTI